MFVDFHPQSLTGDRMKRTITFSNVIIALSRDTWLKNINKCQVLFSNWNAFRAQITLYFRSSALCTLMWRSRVWQVSLHTTGVNMNMARRLHCIFGYKHCVNVAVLRQTVLPRLPDIWMTPCEQYRATFCFYSVDFITFELITWPQKASTVPNASFENITRAKIDKKQQNWKKIYKVGSSKFPF